MHWSIYIDRSVRDVFAVVADRHQDRLWQRRVSSCAEAPGPGSGLGACYEIRQRPLPLAPQVTTRAELITLEPPQVIAWRQLDRLAASLVRYEVTPHGSQACFTQRRQVDWQIPRHLRPWAERWLRRSVSQEMLALKRRLESWATKSELEALLEQLP